MLSTRLIYVFFPLPVYNKLRPIFCSVRNICTRKAHEMKIICQDDFSVIDPAPCGKKLRVLPIGDEPMAFWLLVQMLYH